MIANVGRIGPYMQGLRTLVDHPLVGEVRGVGLIAAIELVLDKKRKVAATTPGDVGSIASRLLHERGIIVRNVNDALSICPWIKSTSSSTGSRACSTILRRL
ncbi:hypothetical protein [Bradyrhizobium sp. 6(2017)]|uniref:hypothetical protein n=1 Tax=Bradyrhizobium sp. 6(2017) TaxID=1197460 RepID=UPI001FED54F5|nr:hypothetical protein [Bradyrhizobium sp. 6(2017)]